MASINRPKLSQNKRNSTVYLQTTGKDVDKLAKVKKTHQLEGCDDTRYKRRSVKRFQGQKNTSRSLEFKSLFIHPHQKFTEKSSLEVLTALIHSS